MEQMEPFVVAHGNCQNGSEYPPAFHCGTDRRKLLNSSEISSFYVGTALRARTNWLDYIGARCIIRI